MSPFIYLASFATVVLLIDPGVQGDTLSQLNHTFTPHKKQNKLFPDFACHKGYKENRGIGKASSDFLKGGGKMVEMTTKKCLKNSPKCWEACVLAAHNILTSKDAKTDDDYDEHVVEYTGLYSEKSMEHGIRRVLTLEGGKEAAKIIASKLRKCTSVFKEVSRLPCNQWRNLVTCVNKAFECQVS